MKRVRVLRKDLGIVVYTSPPTKDHVIDMAVRNIRRNISEDLFTIEVEDIEERIPNWVEVDPLAS